MSKSLKPFAYDRSTMFPMLIIMTFAAIPFTAIAGPLTIWNGVDGAGSLTVTVDDFGAYGTFPNWPDEFEPGGVLDAGFITNLSYVQVSIDPSEMGDGTHRRVLTEHPGILGLCGPGDLDVAITQPNTQQSPSEVSSAFDIVGDDLHFGVTLSQSVSLLPTVPEYAPRAMLEQAYEITNLGVEPVELIITRHVDVDMPWGEGDGSFHHDELVGADFAELGYFQVYAQDREVSTATVVLRTDADLADDPMTTTNSQTGASNYVYYVGKQNMPAPFGHPEFPGGNCPDYDYGTDCQIWDNYGVPNCWKNFVPGVGYNVPGISPMVMGDVFFGLQTEALIEPGETYSLNFQVLYGHRPYPIPEVLHGYGIPEQTRPFTGYIDPRSEVAFPPAEPEPRGLTEAFVQFYTEVWNCDGTDISAGNFQLTETGGGAPPTILTAEYVDPEDKDHVRVTWDRPITLQEWTTLIADVCNGNLVPIVSQGNLGPGVDEPDRVDIAFLPCDVDQSGECAPFDLLQFRQMVNSGAGPELGIAKDYIDTNRDQTVSPFDLLALRQLINGTAPATQPWGGAVLNHPQP